DYLLRRRKATGDLAEQVLIFDQFEEILTIDPMNQRAKEEFFAKVGEALQDRRYWALFIIREDYLAALDPYRPSIPTRLNITLRLDLLNEYAARTAIQQTALQEGVDFTGPAARRLVDDLRKVHIQRPDGGTEEKLGPYVEPVQLQVVCHSIWDKLPPGATQIVKDDIEAVGDVDTALEDYYAEAVVGVAGALG